MLPSSETLNALLRYEPETGRLFWRERPLTMFPRDQVGRSWNSRYAGTEALTALTTGGYRQGHLCGRQLQAHRVIWAMTSGSWPVFVDHINGNRTDNRVCNLRAVSRGENNCNSALRKDSTTGVTGVTFDAHSGKWRASIARYRRFHSLGLFDSVEAAAAARQAAERRLGFHPNHGRRQSSGSRP